MAKAFLVGLCVVLASLAIGEARKTKGAMEQILEANMNPGETLKHFIEESFFFPSFLFIKISFQVS